MWGDLRPIDHGNERQITWSRHRREKRFSISDVIYGT